MRFLPLPVSVVPPIVIGTLLLVVWLGWASFRNPEALWAPGHLSRYHADINRCNQCHQPFHGATSTKCIGCHTIQKFVANQQMDISDFHRQAIRQQRSCLTCHIEHRGPLAQITAGTFNNPHGEFVFLATDTHSCRDCHAFGKGMAERPTLLDNATVRDLIEEGEGSHRTGAFANCLGCHVQGRMELEDEDDD